MNKLKLPTAFVLIICATSCKKKDNDFHVNVNGRIVMIKDSATPYSNTSFVMYQLRTVGSGTARTEEAYVQTFTTDNNGSFELNFNADGLQPIAIDWPSDDEYNDYRYKLAFVNFKAEEKVSLGNIYADTLR